MDGRFFGIPRSSHRPGYHYSVPVQRQPPARSPKVVSIPVHFVESEPTRMRSRSELAVKIQAAFRGFMVRRYVREIDVVRREVEEIERRVCEEETAELMRRDERERLKVNESLMGLLFRLDSVRGVDAQVRELRKKVIKKAIALQEKVDAIAAAADLKDQMEEGVAEVEQGEEGGVDSPDSPDQEEESGEAEQMQEQVADLPDGEEGDYVAAQSEEPILDLLDQKKEGAAEAEQSEEQIANVLDPKEGCGKAKQSEDPDIDFPDQEEGGAEQSEEQIANVLDQKEGCGKAEQGEDRDIDAPDQEEGGADDARPIMDQVDGSSSEGLGHVGNNANDACDLIMEMEPPLFETSGESRCDPSLNPESFLEEVDENAPMKEDDEAEQSKSFQEKEEKEAAEENDRRANNRREEMLGRMMEDNEKMMGLMMQLFKRNEQQTQLLSLLSYRVERLEKAFLCEKLRRKRRQASEGERLLDSNKCGKKL